GPSRRRTISACSPAGARRALATAAVVLAGSAGCRGSTGSASHPADQVTFTIGIGQITASQQDVGLQAIAGNIAVEGLFNMGRDGRPVPVVAESWYIAQDGRSLRIRLRPNVKFHDGTAATSAII